MGYYNIAIVLQILLFFYFEVTTLLNLFPWNDLSKYTRKEKFTEAITNGLFILLCIGLFATKVKWLMAISVMFYLIFLIMQILTWWMPYCTGIHLKQFPKSLYESHFKDTIKWLPPMKDHIIPDAQHNVLQLLSMITLIASSISLFM
ncbi:hypothetical protein [Bacillus norwichensis]|uniref:DUF1772 domain-containing protein n=1 Tax=Bacillus norwichensis TaxID=2762217 RepID=A0ABR8VPW2_9BACI|nr:hypothetical protein [Bacillus norwichensis]MBD8006611.1 hypothetical protein [Bacillus norwichensis]